MRPPIHALWISPSSSISALALALVLLPGPAGARVAQITVAVDGMACPFCGYGIEKRLRKVEGVAEVTIHLREGRAMVTAAEEASLDLDAIRRAVEKAGFTPGRLWLEASGRVHAGEDGWLLRLDSGKGSLPLATEASEVEAWLRALAQRGARTQLRGEVVWRDDAPWLVLERAEERGE